MQTKQSGGAAKTPLQWQRLKQPNGPGALVGGATWPGCWHTMGLPPKRLEKMMPLAQGKLVGDAMHATAAASDTSVMQMAGTHEPAQITVQLMTG